MKKRIKEIDNMEWYVLMHEFNKNEIVQFNIFDSYNFNTGVSEALTKYVDYNSFKEKIRGELAYAFRGKAEYEIVCSGLFAKSDNERYKIDIYTQVLPNLDILCHYIIDSYNNSLS